MYYTYKLFYKELIRNVILFETHNPVRAIHELPLRGWLYIKVPKQSIGTVEIFTEKEFTLLHPQSMYPQKQSRMFYQSYYHY
jgi:hypothetical protein